MVGHMVARGIVGLGSDDPSCTRKRFEGAEHRCAANWDDILLLNTNNATGISASARPLSGLNFSAANGVVIGTYGDVVGMAGDFFAPDTNGKFSLLLVVLSSSRPPHRQDKSATMTTPKLSSSSSLSSSLLP
jgi:hypothetical protein